MKTINILELYKETATNEAGELLSNNVIPILEQNEAIQLDFSETGAISTSFLNSSVGRWIDIFGISTVKDLVKFSGLTKYQAQSLQKYLRDIQGLQKSA